MNQSLESHAARWTARAAERRTTPARMARCLSGILILGLYVTGCTSDGSRAQGPSPVPTGGSMTHSSSGITGYSGAPGSGNCSQCHDAPDGAPPTVTISGPTSLGLSATATFTVSITPAAGSNQAGGGFNAAAPDGTIASGGSGTKIQNGEVTHTTPQGGTGTLSWTFDWTSPGTAGTYTLYAGGVSANLAQGSNGDEVGSATLNVVVSTPGNQPPVANAGLDQTVTDSDNSGSEMVTLDGSASTDDSGIVSYDWSEGGSTIATGQTAMVNFAVGTHTITLTVTDGAGLTDTDTVVVVVQAPAQQNQPPVANAGPDQTVVDLDNSGSEMVTLDGSASTDDSGIVSYDWSEGGSTIATGQTAMVDLAVGTHTITLTVTDGAGLTDTDTAVVVVEASAPPSAGRQGCSPGYWKQPKHFDSWMGYSPVTLTPWDGDGNQTMLEALSTGGGHEIALWRQVAAALLNLVHSDVAYPLTVDEIWEAFTSGDKDQLEWANELGCPLN